MSNCLLYLLVKAFFIYKSVSASSTEEPSTTDSVMTNTVSSIYIRGCYYASWSQYRSGRAQFVPEDYVPGLCTHIFYAFASFSSHFSVQASDPQDLPTPWAGAGMYARINALKANDTQLKTVLSIGGGGFGTAVFQSMSSTAANRAIFINSAIAFVRQYGFDGIDIDWEYPQDSNDYVNYALLMEELKSAVVQESSSSGNDRLIITAAVSALQYLIPLGYNVTALAQYLDWINLMTYDFHGTWDSVTGMNSPLTAPSNDSNPTLSVSYGANLWVQNGMPPEKIAIGVPTYGIGWTLASSSVSGVGAPGNASLPTPYIQSPGIAAYFEICEMLAGGAVRFWDAAYQVPYLVNGSQWFSYDDVQSITNKMNWIVDGGFGGAFVWTLDMDDFNGECSNGGGVRYPLIGAIASVLS